MIKNTLLAGAMVALATASAPAFAQDAGALTGPYVGAIAGIDSVRISDGTDSGSEEDIAYGVVAGYDYQFASGVVVGLEGEWADSGVSDTETDVFVAGDSGTLSAGRDLYVGVRGGFAVGQRGMVYVKGGYTNAKARLTYDDGTGPVSGTDTLDGFRLGLGAEYMLGRGNLGLRGEYRYSDYGEYSYLGVNTGLSAQRHQFMVGLIGKF